MVQTTLERYNNSNLELRNIIIERNKLKDELDRISSIEEFGGLRRIMVVDKIDELDKKIIEMANLKCSHHSMMRVVVEKFIEGTI